MVTQGEQGEIIGVGQKVRQALSAPTRGRVALLTALVAVLAGTIAISGTLFRIPSTIFRSALGENRGNLAFSDSPPNRSNCLFSPAWASLPR